GEPAPRPPRSAPGRDAPRARRRPLGLLRAPRPGQRHSRRDLGGAPQHPGRARAGAAEGLGPGSRARRFLMDDELLYQVADGVATITRNRPEKLNAFPPVMIAAWADALAKADRDPAVNVVVVTGSGRAFCAGGDVARMGEARPGALGLKEELWHHIHRIPKTLEAMDKPVIAMVNGLAVGAGMGMCLMCDVRIASDQARFATGYVGVGLVPGDGDTYFLPRLVGPPQA